MDLHAPGFEPIPYFVRKVMGEGDVFKCGISIDQIKFLFPLGSENIPLRERCDKLGAVAFNKTMVNIGSMPFTV